MTSAALALRFRPYYTEACKTIHLALPIILGELAQIALHFIDISMIGAIDHVQMAAAALSFNLINIPFMLGMGLTMAISQMVSLHNGRKDTRNISHYLFNGFWLCILAGAAITGGLLMLTPVLHHLKQDPAAVHYAVPFYKLICWSLLPMLLFMALKQFTDGLGLTKTAMALSFIMLPLNAVLNWVLIFGHMGFKPLGITGAGIGTLISRIIIFLTMLLIVLCHPRFKPYIQLRKTSWHLKRHTQYQLLKIGLPIGMQITLEMGAFSVSALMAGTFGAVTLAAHQTAITCASTTFMVSLGLSQAAAIRISYAQGQRNDYLYRLIGKSTVVTAFIYGTACAALFILFRHQLAAVFAHEAEVLALSATLFWFAAAFQLSDAIQAAGAGLLRGLKDVKTPTLLIAIAYWGLCIPCSYLLAFVWGMGVKGIWTGFILGLTFAAIALNSRFFLKTKQPLH